MHLQGVDQNRFSVDTIYHEAIKVRPTSTIKTAFLIIALCQKLPRPSFKSNVDNISHCQAYVFLEVEISMAKNFLSFRPLHYKDSSTRPFYLITEQHVAL